MPTKIFMRLYLPFIKSDTMISTIDSVSYTHLDVYKRQGYAYLKGFALETIVTAILFSMVGYFNGNNKTVWVMTCLLYTSHNSGCLTIPIQNPHT